VAQAQSGISRYWNISFFVCLFEKLFKPASIALEFPQARGGCGQIVSQDGRL
jgi:hypothetical protein